MADIKTHLRELSFAVTVGLLKSSTSFCYADLLDSRVFYGHAAGLIDNDISVGANILNIGRYTGEYADIVANGVKLGRAVYENPHFHITPQDKIIWLGNDTHRGNPVDVQVGRYGFSLKEDSFILHNMGLYELLNCLTGSAFPRGLHVFSHFALAAYDLWFDYSWRKLVSRLEIGEWRPQGRGHCSSARLEGTQVVLCHDGITSRVPRSISTYEQFMAHTLAATREKVFSKWIHEALTRDGEYLRLKKACSLEAGEQVCRYIQEHYSPHAMHRFFQIDDTEYYYAKTTSSETTILRVPNRASFPNRIRLKECRAEAPVSQLNIISVFENIHTGKCITFRNECRFSHGQFNGTPEAKMYVEKNTSLAELYDPLE